MNQNLRLAGIVAVCGTLALALSACGKRGGAPQQRAMSVTTATAIKMEAPVIIKGFGNTQDRISVDIVPQVSGMLVKTFMQDGATVTNGQPLFLIDPSDYTMRVQQAEGMVAVDRANVEWNRMTVDRNQPLLAKELISAQDFDTLKTHLTAAEAQLQADEAARDQARLNLSRCMITSSVNGVCSKRFLDDGNLVAAGMTRLTNIRSYDPIIVEFSLSEEYLPQLRAALAAGPVRIEVKPRGDTNSYVGTLDFVDNAVNPMTGTILLRGQVPNPELKLWSEQFVDVSVFVNIIKDAVMVPEGAVQYGKLGTYLFAVSKDNKAELRIVKTGTRYNDLLQIAEGVAAGENVVVLGQLMLAPGTPVMDMSKMPAGGGAPAKK